MAATIDLLDGARNALGESPLWDGAAARLWWVDALAGRIHSSEAEGGDARYWQLDKPVGSIGLASGGGLIAALADGFYRFDPANGGTEVIACPTLGEGAIRFNDGKADRQGRFLSGTILMAENGPDGTLWQLHADGTAVCVERGFRLANALCFSPAGDRLYFADSLEGIVRRYPYDPETGALGAAEPFIDCREHGSAPDGATVDADGNVWIALVQAQALLCVGADGGVLRRIDVPIPYPSCPAFGGPKLDTLYVTSIADSGHRLKSDHPDAGRIAVVRGLDVPGIAEARCLAGASA
ncbi:SMP-30/gluconolactonase/LRE family protein [Sphingomonas sp.]|uniref:SMP-30/gluconolactonase/LRE family protein n=1 Tax=Sphingomonas sp. TaxID=28214 RepID=UPI002DD67061|nr:SMP-30/gluconolactonase/LRE family protein [Sphingomonas sp.]